MAKGTESKTIIFKKLQEIYPNAFWENQDKILRIPMTENGNRVEIKVTLTAAKNNLGGEGIESAFEAPPSAIPKPNQSPQQNNIIEPTEEEKENINRLIASLGL